MAMHAQRVGCTISCTECYRTRPNFMPAYAMVHIIETNEWLCDYHFGLPRPSDWDANGNRTPDTWEIPDREAQ